PFDALARARSSMSFPQPTRHTTYRIAWPHELPDLAQLPQRLSVNRQRTCATQLRQESLISRPR
ncbi:DUF4872 domain-containing protein, partial [Pseudomonas aeruginosa]|nr:DUF4872 domain-containing protein [Pseudomonas aeruginosa]